MISCYRFSSLLPLLLCSAFVFGQGMQDGKVSRAALSSFVSTLSSDSMEGRKVGTDGIRKAGRFIADRFRTAGLIPCGDSGYFQRFSLKEISTGEVYMKTKKRLLRNFFDIVYLGGIPQNTPATKEVVFGGTGSEPELNQINVEDKLVLLFVKNLRSYMDVYRKVAKRKAFGIILANPSNDKQYESIRTSMKDFVLSKRIVSTHRHGLDTFQLLINAFVIPNRVIPALMGMNATMLMKHIASGTIAEVVKRSVLIKCERIEKRLTTENICGMIKGESERSMIVSAHYDHLGRSGKKYYRGADDNASGVAAMLELSEYFASGEQPFYDLIFLATSAEEHGLLGSAFYVNRDDFDSSTVACNINLDMIGRGDNKHRKHPYFLYCIGTDISPEIDKVVRLADAMDDGLSIDFSLNNSHDLAGIYWRSDQYNFHRKNIPAVHFFSGLHDDYHLPSDTANKINFKVFLARVNFLAALISLFDTSQPAAIRPQ